MQSPKMMTMEVSSGFAEVPEAQVQRRRPSTIVSTVAATAFVLVGTMAVLKYAKNNLSSSSGSEDLNKLDINFSFVRRNYSPLTYFNQDVKTKAKYAFMEDYVALIEPSVDMEFHLFGSSKNTFQFTVCDKEQVCQTGSYNAAGTNTYINFFCTPHDVFDISVTEINSKGTTLHTVAAKGVCMYVRREMRSYTEEDMSAFIKASLRLNQVPDSEGVALYGEKFFSGSALTKMHHYNAAQQDQDHIHEGNGYTMQHNKLSNLFEASIQSVDHSVVLPYWDFTIETSEGKAAYNSPLFAPDIYGSMGMPKDPSQGFLYATDKIVDGRIIDGPWKDITVEMNPYEDVPSAYGYMRAPWNMNPSPYVSRYTRVARGLTLPSCAKHFDIMTFDSKVDFYYGLSLLPHATVHSVIGGIYGCDLLQPMYDKGYVLNLAAVCNDWIFVLKQLYRGGYITPNTGCVAASPLEDSKCGFTCAAGREVDMINLMGSFFREDVNEKLAGYRDAFVAFICGGDGGRIFPGEHLESASVADPSFMVIHPTLERLLHAKLLSGGFKDEKWPDNQMTDWVCKINHCYQLSTNSYEYKDDCCYGHFEHDRLFDGNRGKFVGLTNSELEEASDPRSKDYSVSYVYDSFTWEHCHEDFADLFADLSSDFQGVERMKAERSGWRRAEQTSAEYSRKVPRSPLQDLIRQKGTVLRTKMFEEA